MLATKVLIDAKLVSGYAGDHEHVDVVQVRCVYILYMKKKKDVFSLCIVYAILCLWGGVLQSKR